MTDVVEKAAWLKGERESRGWSAAELARRILTEAVARRDELTLSQQAVSHFEGGHTKTIPRWLRYADAVFGDVAAQEEATRERLERDRAAGDLLGNATPEQIGHIKAYIEAGRVLARHGVVDTVPIASIDLAYGMGGTFADGAVQEDVMHFPRAWVESITYSPPALLTWARGRGDSMAPTINDNDLILIDRSQRRVAEQDAIWALTIGDIAMVKRLRIRGAKVAILSDNDRVSPDDAHVDEVNIVGRVVFVGRRT